jgi:hypothetical protein
MVVVAGCRRSTEPWKKPSRTNLVTFQHSTPVHPHPPMDAHIHLCCQNLFNFCSTHVWLASLKNKNATVNSRAIFVAEEAPLAFMLNSLHGKQNDDVR